MRIFVWTLVGKFYELYVDDFNTIKDVKIKIEDIIGLPPNQQSFWLNLINYIWDLILSSDTLQMWKNFGWW